MGTLVSRRRKNIIEFSILKAERLSLLRIYTCWKCFIDLKLCMMIPITFRYNFESVATLFKENYLSWKVLDIEDNSEILKLTIRPVCEILKDEWTDHNCRKIIVKH